MSNYTNHFKEHGELAVKGLNLIDSSGSLFRIRGISTYWLHPFRQFLSREAFITLRDEWGINCLRFPVSTYHYCILDKGEETEELLNEAVELATELGLYVIIDWHVLGEQDPMRGADKASLFFDRISARYSSYGNILYEICNEPNGAGTWDRISMFADLVIPVIRKNAPHAVILVGTPCWSQDVDVAAEKPLAYENIMYSLHFYGATHKQFLRDKAECALAAGIPLFISEFGLCEATGNGPIDTEEAMLWKEFIDRHLLSYVCWNLSTCDESSALLRHSAVSLAHWRDDEISEEGRIFRKWTAADA